MIPHSQLDTEEKRSQWKTYLSRCFSDRRWFIESHLKIRTKDQRLVPLILNEAQDRLFQLVEQQEAANKPVRIIGVKPRKVGLSTGIQSIFFHRASTHRYVKGLTVAHDIDATEEMFTMDGLFYDELPEPLKPMKRYSNRKELVFENPDEVDRAKRPGLRSQLRIATAGNEDLGRSKDIHLLHCSESPYWSSLEATELSVLNSVPDLPGTMVFKEGTPNGVGTKFHRDYKAAKAGETAYLPYFMAWFEFKEYSMALEVADGSFGDSLEDDERRLQSAYGLTLEQLHWRQWAIKNKCNGDPDKFAQEYPSNDVECFLVSGRSVFNPLLLRQILESSREPGVTGNLRAEGSRTTIDPNPRGYLKVWRQPERGHSYVIGADVAEGLLHRDYSCAQVLDRQDLSKVASWHGHIDADLFGEELAKLGRYYNDAFIGCEVNNHGLSSCTALRRLGYSQLYYRQDLDAVSNKSIDKLGWLTNRRTKPLIIDNLAKGLRERTIGDPDKDTIEELLTFVRNEDGTTSAQEGCFDDRVMALAIAVQMHQSAGLAGIFPSLAR